MDNLGDRKNDIANLLKNKGTVMNATQIADELECNRANVSRYLNDLYKNGDVTKSEGRPVLYQWSSVEEKEIRQKKINDKSVKEMSFKKLIGSDDSLKVMIQQAEAAILYPPRGLHTIIFGETGTGKSLFAECMYQFALESEMVKGDAPFIRFNCADYANNPQLLFAHIFGVKKGAYTGADQDKQGLIEKADGGILFLDEIHRLPPEGQEMLFTFIDKGFYRPLGESSITKEASVQIIGATTETSENFLSTFNRRIPMAITLPPISKRTIDERYGMVMNFFEQEVGRLNQDIIVERDAMLALMLYEPEANIGQIQRDIKVVCAKAFLYFRTHDATSLYIRLKDLPLNVQKGRLEGKSKYKKIDVLMDRLAKRTNEKNTQVVTFKNNETVEKNDQKPTVYETIDKKVSETDQQNLKSLNLKMLIDSDNKGYFKDYIEQLSGEGVRKELLPDDVWAVTNEVYDLAQNKLGQKYNESARFAFGLHLVSAIERIRKNVAIVHPDLNNLRQKNPKAFRVALEMADRIEHEFDIEIPLDEIGFITMFLSTDLSEKKQQNEIKVGIIVLMHGASTASSMLQTAQELLGTTKGKAINMPLDVNVSEIYDQVRDYVLDSQEQLKKGLLLLTDMGSLTSFASMLGEETGINIRAVSMTSTLVVLESLRIAIAGRELEDIYANAQHIFESSVKEQFFHMRPRKKAVIVACFTGEGVAARLYDRIVPIVNEDEVKVIRMQYLEKDAFKKHINTLMRDYDVKAIVGTVEVSYQRVPFFSALDIFNDETLQVLQRMLSDSDLTQETITALEGSINSVNSVPDLIHTIQTMIIKIQSDLQIVLDPEIIVGIMMHLAFLVDSRLKDQPIKPFDNIQEYSAEKHLQMEIVKTALIIVEKMYNITISDDEVAYIVQIFMGNTLNKISV